MSGSSSSSNAPRPDPRPLDPLFDMGFKLIPLHVWNAVEEGGKYAGKRPLGSNWRDRAGLSRAEAEEYMSKGHNIGVLLDLTVLVVDVDPRAFPIEGEVSGVDGKPLPPDPCAELERLFGVGLASCPTVLTGSSHPVHGRGRHHYLRLRLPDDWTDADRLRNTLPNIKGVEFKSLGRQVVAPGSVHPETGLHYEWSPDHPPLHEIREAPAALVAALRTTRRTSAAAKEEGAEWTPQVLEEYLARLDPVDFRDHDEWLKLMIACNAVTGGAGLEEFTAWSTRDPMYAHAGSTIAYRWDTFDPDKEGGRGLKTLEYIARQKGIDLPTLTLARGDFEGVAGGEDEGDAGPAAEETVMSRLLRDYCLVIDGGRVRVFFEDHDPDLGRNVWVRMTTQDFEKFYSDTLVETPGGKLLEAGKAWMASPKKRKYTGIVFRPNERERDTRDGKLNLWTGFAVEPSPRGTWTLLEELIYLGIADGNETHAKYILDWMARAVQQPSEPGQVALVLKGGKGTGKSTLGSAFVRLFGNHGMHITSSTLLTGRFNAHMRDCIALFADEALWAGSKEAESVLKGLITERQITYEGKGRDPEQGRNMLHIVMASNLRWVVPAGMDGERRFAVFEVSDRYAVRKGDSPDEANRKRKWFEALHQQLRDQGGYSRLLYDLMRRDVSRWHPFDDMPVTQALREQQDMGLNILEQFVYEALVDGDASAWRPHDDRWDEPFGEVRVLKEDFHAAFLAFAEARGEKHRLYGLGSRTTVGRELKRMFGPRLKTRRVTSPIEGREGLGRPYEYVFPPLDECRALWNAMSGSDAEWGEG